MKLVLSRKRNRFLGGRLVEQEQGKLTSVRVEGLQHGTERIA